MRMFTAAVGLIGVLVSQAAFAQEAAPAGTPPAAGAPAPASGTAPPTAETAPPPAATQPPPVETAPPPPPPPAVAATGSAPMPFGASDGPNGPSVWGILPWGGYGIGARYMLPIPITQLLTRTRFRDYWALEFGADVLRINYDYIGFAGSYTWTEVVPVVGMMWQVWFTENFAAYPKVEAGYAFGWYSNTMTGQTLGSGGNHFYPGATAGVLYKLQNGVTLRAEAGYLGAKAGVAWLF
jgi:hypothetical protein